MRDFGRTGFQLRHARWEIKLAYTGFLLFISLGLCTNAIFQIVRIGPTPGRIAAHYRGGDVGQEMAFPKTFAELLELTHFHTFIMGVIFLILAHLLASTRTPLWLRRACIILAFAGSLGDVASYWLIRYLSPLFAVMQLMSWAGGWVGYGGMIVMPLWDMWRRDEVA